MTKGSKEKGGLAEHPKVILHLGDIDVASDPIDGYFTNIAAMTVTFAQSAGIRNPSEGGKKTDVMVVTTSEDDEGKATLTFPRTLSLSSSSGTRGSKVTVTGRGFKDKTTATVWLDGGAATEDGLADVVNGTRDSDEIVLCTATVAGDDTFSCEFTSNASFKTFNSIMAVDGRNQKATQAAKWEIKGRVTAVPDVAAIGDTISIQFEDFPEGDLTLTKLTLGGVNILPSGSHNPHSGNLPIVIPNGVSLGKQSLDAATANSGTRRVTVTIGGAGLTVTPSEAVPGQTVTVSGRGFTGSTATTRVSIKSMSIGGSPVAVPGNVYTDNGGSWSAEVELPVGDATEPGTYDLQATDSSDRPGLTKITIKERTLSLEPKEGRVGSTVTVTGSGWPAEKSIEVEYKTDDGETVNVRADSDGNFSAMLEVSDDALIPSTNQVEARYNDRTSTYSITEQQAHQVPAATASVDPVSGPPGTTITVSGEGFKTYRTLTATIGGTNVAPQPVSASTDAEGKLSGITLLVPGLNPGSANVKLTVDDTEVNVPFTVTTAPAQPATMEQPTEQYLMALIEEMVDGSPNLVDAYRFSNETQSWDSYVTDPAFAEFNTMTTVMSGDVLLVRLQAAQEFNGMSLKAGWSQVVVP